MVVLSISRLVWRCLWVLGFIGICLEIVVEFVSLC